MKILKSNKFIVFTLIIFSFLLISNPSLVFKSSLNAISVWTYKIFPVMFPFFIITRLILNLSDLKKTFLDKFSSKLFNSPTGASQVFFLSVLAGYPTGAKLVSNLYERNLINNDEAQNLMSFCSVSGPMFIVGTVGVAIFSCFKIGVIILISNILGAILNGIFFRSKSKSINNNLKIESKNIDLFDIIYDSVISILVVAAFIVLSFIFVDILNYFNIVQIIAHSICCVININKYENVVVSILSGFIEMTRGIIELNVTNIPIKIKATIASGLIGFGGLSIILQSLTFLTKIKMPVKKMFFQKLIQGISSALICFVLCFFIWHKNFKYVKWYYKVKYEFKKIWVLK